MGATRLRVVCLREIRDNIIALAGKNSNAIRFWPTGAANHYDYITHALIVPLYT